MCYLKAPVYGLTNQKLSAGFGQFLSFISAHFDLLFCLSSD